MRLFRRLTDSETLLGNVVLTALLAGVFFAWCGCSTEEAGLGLAGRAPVAVDAPNDLAVVRVPDALAPGVLPDAAPALAPDVSPPLAPDAGADTGPSGAFGTPYPACAADVVVEESGRMSCRANFGKCRTDDGWVCVVCQVTTPCARASDASFTLTQGPRCENGVSVCMSSCPIRGGDYCLHPHQ